jgi:hypothetical protein
MVAAPANIRVRRSSLSLLASYFQIGFRDGLDAVGAGMSDQKPIASRFALAFTVSLA